jgi:transcriptional regulator with XRE-family HTH domain
MELRKYRRIAGLTQQQLAERSGVDVAIISRLENGRRRSASYATLLRLATALHLEVHELVQLPHLVKPEKGIA